MAAALRRRGGRWLLQQRPAHKHHGGLWEFLGGKVEDGEAPVNALIRELREELGIVCDVGALHPAAFAQDMAPDGEKSTVILLYNLSEWSGEPSALEPRSSIGCFTSAQIAALPKPPLDIALCAQMFGQVSAEGGG